MPETTHDDAHPVVRLLAPLSSVPPGKPSLRDLFLAVVAACPFAAVVTAFMGLCTAIAPYTDVVIGEALRFASIQLPSIAESEKSPFRHFGLCVLSGAMVGFYRMWKRSHPPIPDAPDDSPRGPALHDEPSDVAAMQQRAA